MVDTRLVFTTATPSEFTDASITDECNRIIRSEQTHGSIQYQSYNCKVTILPPCHNIAWQFDFANITNSDFCDEAINLISAEGQHVLNVCDKGLFDDWEELPAPFQLTYKWNAHRFEFKWRCLDELYDGMHGVDENVRMSCGSSYSNMDVTNGYVNLLTSDPSSIGNFCQFKFDLKLGSEHKMIIIESFSENWCNGFDLVQVTYGPTTVTVCRNEKPGRFIGFSQYGNVSWIMSQSPYVSEKFTSTLNIRSIRIGKSAFRGTRTIRWEDRNEGCNRGTKCMIRPNETRPIKRPKQNKPKKSEAALAVAKRPKRRPKSPKSPKTPKSPKSSKKASSKAPKRNKGSESPGKSVIAPSNEDSVIESFTSDTNAAVGIVLDMSFHEKPLKERPSPVNSDSPAPTTAVQLIESFTYDELEEYINVFTDSPGAAEIVDGDFTEQSVISMNTTTPTITTTTPTTRYTTTTSATTSATTTTTPLVQFAFTHEGIVEDLMSFTNVAMIEDLGTDIPDIVDQMNEFTEQAIMDLFTQLLTATTSTITTTVYNPSWSEWTHSGQCTKTCFHDDDIDFGYKLSTRECLVKDRTGNCPLEGSSLTTSCVRNELPACNINLPIAKNQTIAQIDVKLECVVVVQWTQELADNTSPQFRAVAIRYEMFLLAKLTPKYHSSTGYTIKSIVVSIFSDSLSLLLDAILSMHIKYKISLSVSVTYTR